MNENPKVEECFEQNAEITPRIWLIAFIVMLPLAMVSISTSSANVALNYIAGSFAISVDDSTWVLTSYLIANAVILPATSWLCDIFGRKKFIIIATSVFTWGSLLCGLSTGLPMMIVSRIIQGLGGGALMPIAQSVLLERFPRSKRGMAMAIYSIGMLTAPVVGPSLGGWITDNFSWNWIYYINVPIGIFSIILSSIFITDNKREKLNKHTDYVGILALIGWVTTMQIVLDQGQKVAWFQSASIYWLAVVSAVFFMFFLVWESECKDPIVDLTVFKNVNYTIGCSVCGIMTAILYGTIALLPLFLESVLRYNACLSGSVLMARGISCILTTVLIGIVADRVNKKLVMVVGFIIWGFSFYMFGNLNLSISQDSIILPNLVCGLGQGLVYSLLTTVTFESLRNDQVQNATGLFNLIRNIGGSAGVSSMKTMLADNAQVNQVYLVANLAPTSLLYRAKLMKLINFFGIHMNLYTATHKASGYIYKILLQQATILSYMNLFKFYALVSFILAMSVMLFRRIKKSKA